MNARPDTSHSAVNRVLPLRTLLLRLLRRFPLACATLSWLLVMPVAATAASGHWENLEGSDCKVWFSNMPERRSIRWTGACREGTAQGAGVLSWEYNADGKFLAARYEGTLAGGKANGYGKLTAADGYHAEGQFRDINLHGYGKCSYADGSSYEGQWSNGYPNGIGTHIEKDGVRVSGRWINGRIVGIRRRSSADGQWSSEIDASDGGSARGVISIAQQSVSAGSFRYANNKFLLHGNGIFLWPSERKVYLGHFVNDLPDGQGAFVIPDKKSEQPGDASVYAGNWANGCLWKGNWFTKLFVDNCKRS